MASFSRKPAKTHITVEKFGHHFELSLYPRNAKMTSAIKGPAIFVVQYVKDEAPFNTLEGIAKWAADLGYKGIQIPIDERLIDIEKAAANDQTYCNEIHSTLKKIGIELTELSTHLQGQLVAVHPAYDVLFDGFAPAHVHGKPREREQWARSILFNAAKASKNLGLKAHATFSGALAWPYVYPWPQRPEALVDEAFSELAKRWKPILDAFDEAGVDVCYEVHPGEDLHDGVSFERFLKAVDNHKRVCICFDPSHFVLQQLDYLSFIDHYHDRIKIFHVKDAEFRPNGKQGVYGGYSSWQDRAGRFRAIGDGQVDFKSIFTKLVLYGYSGWAILENECAVKDPIICAEEAVDRIKGFMIPVAKTEFDDFAAAGGSSRNEMRKILGLEA
jgi:sugar phosphate isomerase/epimerase